MTMKRSTKGVLLSGLVYPGLGQWSLGRVYLGAAIMVLTTAGMGIIIYRIVKRVYLAIDQILPLMAKGTLDFDMIMEAIGHTSFSSWDVETISVVVVIGCWAVSIVHAYFLGRKLDGHIS
jgi:hypothetical protein